MNIIRHCLWASFVLGVAVSCLDPASFGECQTGNLNCDCYVDESCSDGLVCVEGLCHEPEAVLGGETGGGPWGEWTSTSGLPSGGEPVGDESEACDAGETSCADQDLLVCEAGEWSSYDCGELCNYHGYESVGCAGDACVCDERLDEVCDLGVQAFCACAPALGESCGGGVDEQLYQGCWFGDSELMRCFADQVFSGDQIICSIAFDSCL